jgi:hypothetical protein
LGGPLVAETSPVELLSTTSSLANSQSSNNYFILWKIVPILGNHISRKVLMKPKFP